MPQIDQQRERVQDDLRGRISGDVHCDDIFLQLYASDASLYEIRPLGVVRPRTASDVAAAMQYAWERHIPVHARGAGTGMAGESLGGGLIMDFSRHLRRIIRTDAESVHVQPGVVRERLNAHLRQYGRVFGPDPSYSPTTTIGSTIAVNGAGSHWLQYGSASRHLRGLKVVLADGHAITAGREPLVGGKSTAIDPRKRELVDSLTQILTHHAELIRRKWPKTPVNRCGYHLAGILQADHLDLGRLLAGSEGTLGLITEAHLATQPLPRASGITMLLFDSMEKASRSVLEILPRGLSACDLMDRRHLALACEAEPRFEPLIPRETEALLLVEIQGNDPVEVRDRLYALIDDVRHQRRLAFGARQAFEPSERQLFRKLAEKIQPAFSRSKSDTRPVPLMEDMAVPAPLLPEFLVRLQNVLKRHEVTASVFCHAGQGQIHLHPFLDMAAADAADRMRALAADLYQEVLAAEGTISAEHGCGLSRTPFVRQQYGELYEVFRQIKALFDPRGILNPGKVVSDAPDGLFRNWRAPVTLPRPLAPAGGNGDAPEMRNLIELQLNWDPKQVAEAARHCNGCGDCRLQTSDSRMCPIFRILPGEEASPRAKANLIRGVLTDKLGLTSLTSDEFKQVADLCVHCYMCTLECPAQVDIPKLMLEGKGAYVAANGLPLGDWVLSHLDLLCSAGSRISPLVNWALANPQMRWLMEKVLGIAHARKLPRLTSRTFLRRAARRRLTRPNRRSGRKVAYFVDMYANYHDPQLAEAVVAVLEHNGISVYVPAEQKQAGMTAIGCGNLPLARRLAKRNTAVFAEAVRQGYHIVTSEPAVAVCLTREYGNLVDDDDVRLVASQTSEVCTYLWRLHTQGKLQLDFKPIHATIGYHTPCRMKALGVGQPGEYLLRLIPGLTVEHCEEGCSGMAGVYGLKRQNFRASLRIGWRLINRLRDPNLQAGTTECSTCKMQMEQGTTKPTIHPIKLLALSYGLLPEMGPLVTGTGKEPLVT